MSSAMLEILDLVTLNVIGYGEYNGTSDSVPSEFVTDYSEIEGQKSYFLNYKDCICENKFHQGVILFSNYGGTSYWPSKVCIKCKVITGVTSPYAPDYGYIPQPEDEKKFWNKFHAEGWPKDGDPRKVIKL